MGKKAVFLDRDGVINEIMSERVKYINKPEDFYLLPGVPEAIRLLNDSGFSVFVVTNQGGVGGGFMKEKTLLDIHAKMEGELEKEGARLDGISCCIHRPNAGCACRKPSPAMIFVLAETHGIDLAESFMVGDRATDVEAGKAAGCKTVLVGTKEDAPADAKTADLLAAAKWIVSSSS